MRASPRSARSIPFRVVALYVAFLGGAWAMVHVTAGSTLGLLLGPIAAQATMVLVILLGSRTMLRSDPAPSRLVTRRRLRFAPLLLIALGGFLFQATTLAGSRLLSAAEVPVAGWAPGPLVWLVLAATSLVGAPLLEELFFRGMLQPMLSRRNVATGLLATAALFGLAHGLDMPARVVPAFVQGLVLGGVMLLTGRLLAAIVIHALNNALVLAAMALAAFQAAGGTVHPGFVANGTTLIALGVLSLALVGWGFYRVVREPRIR